MILPPEQHLCSLPDPYKTHSKTLALCGGCQRWFWRGEQYVGFGFNNVWWPVRWWHFGMRRRIKEHSR